MLKKAKVSASILAINYNDRVELERNIKLMNLSKPNFIHLDVMDGKFVKNSTFDHKLVKTVQSMTNIPLDVHLMINNPENFIEDYFIDGVSMISFHYEATSNPEPLLNKIKANGIKAGITINPDTDVFKIKDIIENNICDYVLVMSVNPGAYGQKYIDGTEEKVKIIKNMNKKMTVSVDGGVNPSNAKMLRKYGADILVSAGAIFNSNNPKTTIKKLSGRLF